MPSWSYENNGKKILSKNEGWGVSDGQGVLRLRCMIVVMKLKYDRESELGSKFRERLRSSDTAVIRDHRVRARVAGVMGRFPTP